MTHPAFSYSCITIGTVFRYEKSGELHGLTRVRTFTQDDAHIFVRQDQVKAEFENVIDVILKVFKIFGFENYEAQVSLHDPKDTEKYIGTPEIWAESENASASWRDLTDSSGTTSSIS